jgi:hypothetical protein
MLFTYYIGLATLSAKSKHNNDLQSDHRLLRGFQKCEQRIEIS